MPPPVSPLGKPISRKFPPTDSGPIRSAYDLMSYLSADATNAHNDLPKVVRAIYVGTSGTLVYVDWENQTVTLTGIAPGIWHPICARQVLSSSTALGIVGGY